MHVDVIWVLKESSELKMIPKFFAWGPVETSSVPIGIIGSGSVDILWTVGRNCMDSALSSLNLSMLARFQDLISAIHVSRKR